MRVVLVYFLNKLWDQEGKDGENGGRIHGQLLNGRKRGKEIESKQQEPVKGKGPLDGLKEMGGLVQRK